MTNQELKLVKRVLSSKKSVTIKQAWINDRLVCSNEKKDYLINRSMSQILEEKENTNSQLKLIKMYSQRNTNEVLPGLVYNPKLHRHHIVYQYAKGNIRLDRNSLLFAFNTLYDVCRMTPEDSYFEEYTKVFGLNYFYTVFNTYLQELRRLLKSALEAQEYIIKYRLGLLELRSRINDYLVKHKVCTSVVALDIPESSAAELEYLGAVLCDTIRIKFNDNYKAEIEYERLFTVVDSIVGLSDIGELVESISNVMETIGGNIEEKELILKISEIPFCESISIDMSDSEMYTNVAKHYCARYLNMRYMEPNNRTKLNIADITVAKVKSILVENNNHKATMNRVAARMRNMDAFGDNTIHSNKPFSYDETTPSHIKGDYWSEDFFKSIDPSYKNEPDTNDIDASVSKYKVIPKSGDPYPMVKSREEKISDFCRQEGISIKDLAKYVSDNM